MSIPFQCVIDASVAVKVFLPEPFSAEAMSPSGSQACIIIPVPARPRHEVTE